MHTEEALRLTDRLIIEAATNSLVITDPHLPDQPIIYANPAFLQITGYSQEEIIGRNCRFLQGPDTDPAAIEQIRQAIRAEQSCKVVLLNYRKDGTQFWQELTISPVHDSRKRLLYFIGVQTDITPLKEAYQTLSYQALHDSLTGLPNRALLYDRADQALRLSQRTRSSLALLLLDLDHFKEINDTFGHHAGDLLLQEVSGRLQGIVRETDTVARLGGDEFAVLLTMADQSGAISTAERISSIMEQPVMLEGHYVDVGASIGIALAPDHGTDIATLLRHADVAMYVAKRSMNSDARYTIYSADHDHYNPHRLILAGELRHAIAENQLILYYQPKVNLFTHRIDSVETLVRWKHPQYGMIPPIEFIPLAERAGLIKPLTLWVIRTALAQYRQWQTQQDISLPVAVNLSARLLSDDRLVETIADLLQGAGVRPECLEIEVTESAMMSDPEGALAILKRLNAMGIRIAIDDFGTGYSSLSYLQRLPVTAVKIDKSFVVDMEVNADDATIARSIIDLGHNLGLTVIAEGVETADMYTQLASMGCDTAQGYYLSKPVPAADLTHWLASSPWGNS